MGQFKLALNLPLRAGEGARYVGSNLWYVYVNEPVLFSSGPERVTPGQVLAAAAFWGELDPLCSAVRLRLACQRLAHAEGIQVMAGQITIGGFVAFNALVAMTYAPILTVLNLWDEFQMSGVLMNRINDISEFEPEQGRDRSHLQPVSTLEGRVELRGSSSTTAAREAR